ncbi:Helix-turn-helix domain-containing protein [Amycolatopsis marina]|uniref:Helix-turn-helix domain-containing protein n=1 Tax=Amycolatopsis marina TaxID=490629 RepID=A0A1I0XHY5_9PSEU|nr:helix-turn-helix transcriptional regulator [Amycolatopsis marina]SFB00046.1 Helix-turn-helix domain-containing protein [Amycolatopsis marina]
MGYPRKPNFRMRLLGRTLRRLREQSRMTQEEVAARMRFSTAKMSRLEQGQLPNYHEFLAMLDLYGVIVSDYDEYIRMFDRARERGWWHAYGLDDKGFVSLEAEASEVRNYELGYIPGLLQTETYMRGSFVGARLPLPGEKLENEVAVRLRRQHRLTKEPLLRLHAIMDESVLWRPIPDAEGFRAQLRFLIERAHLPTVTLQVVPRTVAAHPGRAGSFVILRFPIPDEPEIGYVEHGFGSFQTEKASEVRAARLTFQHLEGLALDQTESLALIERVAAQT